MITINELLAQDVKALKGQQHLVGILVLSNDNVFLIDDSVKKNDDGLPSVLLSQNEIKYALMAQLPLMHGAKSIFFHKAEVKGDVEYKESLGVCIKPKSIFVEVSKNRELKEIDFSTSMIERGKLKSSGEGAGYFESIGMASPDY